MNTDHGELHPDNARSAARMALAYSDSFGPHFGDDLGRALDWITDLGAMVLNLSDRVASQGFESTAQRDVREACYELRDALGNPVISGTGDQTLQGQTIRMAAAKLREAAGRGSGEPVAQTFGIIDPDYARVFTQARIMAWQYGYACLAHGSLTRDLDLLLVPWTDKAQSKDVDYFAPRIAEAAGLKVHHGPPSVRPHGRKTWTLTFPGFADPRWVDLSVLLPQAEPLNFDQLQSVMCSHFGEHELTDDEKGSAEAFARAIERAHNIRSAG